MTVRRMALAKLTLVLGGARSGKSRHAEALVTAEPRPWTYIATAEAFDDEMAERIAEHRRRRGEGWRTVEAPLDLAEAVRKEGLSGRPILIDCLTLWLSNTMLRTEAHAASGLRRDDGLIEAIDQSISPIVAVSNEVGLGIVPETPLGRRFRDAQGRLNQAVAAAADRVVLMVAGLPLQVK
jgi:adenosylcobinamide kinase/adenosylcobinamide-phosphate guanylyltransferase